MSLKSVEKTGTNEYTLELSIGAESFEEALNKTFKKNKNKISIPGFRKGKAPRKFIEKYYGENVFYDDALEEAFPAVYEAAIEEAAILPVDSPHNFDIKSIGADGVELSCIVTVKPEITLGEYKGITAVKADVEVTADDVKNEIEQMQKSNARQIEVDDRAIQDKDIVSIDFEGFVDGVAFDGGKAEGHSLTIGSGQFIPGFEEQLIGHEIGESFDINVSFPDEYTEELAGKDAMFKIKINSIQFEELPELDDEFAKDVSEYETLDELKKSIEEDMLKRKQESADRNFEQAVIDKLAEASDAEIPECMVEKAIDSLVSDFEYRMKSQGLSLDLYLQYMGMDYDAFRDNYRDSAIKKVKTELAIEKIAQIENIEISDDEIEAEYAKFAENYHMELEKIKEILSLENIKGELTASKTVKFIVDNAVAEKEEKAEKDEKPVKAKKTAKKENETDSDENSEEKKPAKKAAAKKTAAKKAETPKEDAAE